MPVRKVTPQLFRPSFNFRINVILHIWWTLFFLFLFFFYFLPTFLVNNCWLNCWHSIRHKNKIKGIVHPKIVVIYSPSIYNCSKPKWIYFLSWTHTQKKIWVRCCFEDIGNQNSWCFIDFHSIERKKYPLSQCLNAFSPQGVTFDHASIFDVLGAL